MNMQCLSKIRGHCIVTAVSFYFPRTKTTTHRVMYVHRLWKLELLAGVKFKASVLRVRVVCPIL